MSCVRVLLLQGRKWTQAEVFPIICLKKKKGGEGRKQDIESLQVKKMNGAPYGLKRREKPAMKTVGDGVEMLAVFRRALVPVARTKS